LGRHYTSARNFEAFHELQQAIYQELRAAGMFDAQEGTTSPATAAAASPTTTTPAAAAAAA
jgi:hypothetical protein